MFVIKYLAVTLCLSYNSLLKIVAKYTKFTVFDLQNIDCVKIELKGMEHVRNIFISFDKYLFLEVINILIWIGLFKQCEIQLFKKYLNAI